MSLNPLNDASGAIFGQDFEGETNRGYSVAMIFLGSFGDLWKYGDEGVDLLRNSDDARDLLFYGGGGKGKKGIKEYQVGKYNDLSNARRKPEDSHYQIHHVPQKHPANQVIDGYDGYRGVSIVLTKTEHQKILNPLNIKGTYMGNSRDLVAKGIKDLRKTNAPASSIRELLQKIKDNYGDALNK